MRLSSFIQARLLA